MNFRKIGKYIGVAAGVFFAATLLWVLLLKWVPVTYTPLMLIRSVQYRSQGESHALRRQWKPLDEISPEMVRAVIASEDGKFLRHHGFDWAGMRAAFAGNRQGKRLKGGSTISQQVAKNVFLWPSRSYVRKAFEAYFTVLIEVVWGKRRIMEVYLNVVEEGRHVYGVEAASQLYFGHAARSLSAYEAASLAAVLPSPRYYRVVNPSAGVRKRIARIYANMSYVPRVRW
ncbi:MAG: monofunctional biosynthetic peptidoglycan transglycosylase [Bacteroidales bacterium]|nr:monofunctional biosynthetic peptidoglycan transglycosylase [Bacteroidales bacterium]